MAELKTCVEALQDNILNDCNDTYGMGVEDRAWIFLKSDLDYLIDRENLLITEMTLAEGKKGHYIHFPAEDAANGIKVEDQNAAIGDNYTKTSPLVLLANNPRNAKAIRALKSGRYVIIFELKAKDDAQKQGFIAMGAEMGARGQDAVWDAYSEDTRGGFSINMVEKNATLPMVFVSLGENAEATRAALESMMSASV